MTLSQMKPTSTMDDAISRIEIVPASKYHRLPANHPFRKEPQVSLRYMDIKVVVDGEVIKVGLVFPWQHSLKKLWEDIKEFCFDKPIRHTEDMKVNLWIHKCFQC